MNTIQMTLAYFVFGCIVAFSIAVVWILVEDTYMAIRYELNVRRFFKKIEEFRNDFS